MNSKVIHYCWFGDNPMPQQAKECIESWKKYCPGYEIKKWDASNFDFSICDYAHEAYEAKMWAFVSDYARFWILYNYGGMYFDTDLELINSIDDLIDQGPFFACENHLYENKELLYSSGKGQAVAAGLGLAANAGLGLYKEILDDYSNSHFITKYGVYDTTTVVTRVTRILCKHGFDPFKNEIQHIAGVYIYPEEYFGGCNNLTRKIEIRHNTRAIHYYAGTWASKPARLAIQIKKRFAGKGKLFKAVGSIIAFPLQVFEKSRTQGFWNYTKYYLRKK